MTQRKVSAAILANLLAIAILSGCGVARLALAPVPGKPVVVPAYTVPRPQGAAAPLLAGVGRADITPPPGYPTGGDGPAGNQTRGYWTRLHARAYFFMDGEGRTLVLVSCDLFAMPGGLSAMVAHNVAETWSHAGVVIPPEAVIVAATHTHQSPGNFMTSRVYNQFASKYGGFSSELFDFLVKRVMQAVDDAVKDALDHKQEQATLSMRSGRVPYMIQMNRSPRTFLLNADAASLMDSLHPWSEPAFCQPGVETGEAREDWDLPGCPRLRATDPAMTVLEVRRGTTQVGLLVFFAVHPTVLDSGAPFYSADFTGYAMTRLERETDTGGGKYPVAGFFNGPEGDVVTRRGRRDVRDVARLGDMLAESVRSIQALPPVPVPVTSIETRREDIGPGAVCAEGSTPLEDSIRRLSRTPVPGTALLGGGEGDRTPFYSLGWREGIRRIAADGQGGKNPGLDSTALPFLKGTDILAGPETFPQSLPISYAKLGFFQIGAFPAELSTATAAPIRKTLGGHGAFEIIGLANEYTSYVASPDEYPAQDYMAASTLWGPFEGPLFACKMAKLCVANPQQLPRTIDKQTFLPGDSPEKLKGGFALGPSAVGECRLYPDEELERVILNRRGSPERGLPFFFWHEDASDGPDEFQYATGRTVRIQVKSGDAWITRQTAQHTADDDRGAGLLTMLMAAPAGNDKTHYWAVLWLAPVLEDGLREEPYRFEIEIRRPNGKTRFVRSQPFHPRSRGPVQSDPEQPKFDSCVKDMSFFKK